MLLLWRVSQWEEDHAYESPMQRLCTTARSGWDLLAVVASLLTQLTVALDRSPSIRQSLSVLRSADFQGASLPCRVCFSDFVVAVVFRCTVVVVSAVWRIVPCVFLSLASRLLGRGSIGPSSNLCLWNGARFVRCAVPGVNKEKPHIAMQCRFSDQGIFLSSVSVLFQLFPPPPGNVYCFRHSREVLLFGYFQGSSRGTCILRPRIEVLIGLT